MESEGSSQCNARAQLNVQPSGSTEGNAGARVNVKLDVRGLKPVQHACAKGFETRSAHPLGSRVLWPENCLANVILLLSKTVINYKSVEVSCL